MSTMALSLMVPFLVKVSSPGFVPPSHAKSEKCEVFEDSIHVTKMFAQRKFEYNFPYYPQNSIPELIELAANETLHSEDNYLCDGPWTVVSANLMKDGKSQEVVLYSTGGCGSPKKFREGPNSSALIDLASTFCPTTH